MNHAIVAALVLPNSAGFLVMLMQHSENVGGIKKGLFYTIGTNKNVFTPTVLFALK